MSKSTTAAKRPARGDTKRRLLEAAERLIAEHGIAGTSTRAILQAAGQRNESALQYHFGGRNGLLEALYQHRAGQVDAERERVLGEMLESGDPIDVRRLCEVAFLPPIRLARRDPSFVQFLKVVGQMAFLPDDKLREQHEKYEIGSVGKLRDLLRDQLDLPPVLLRRRLELLQRNAAVALSQRARNDQSFEGPDADFYVETTLDAMAAILETPVSESTEKALAALPSTKDPSTARARRRKSR